LYISAGAVELLVVLARITALTTWAFTVSMRILLLLMRMAGDDSIRMP
jgi:hypothetical protein